MFIHLLATLAMGAVAALAVWTIARTIGWKKPGIAYPIAVALGMLSYSIYDEYSWFTRASSALPNRLEVVRTYATSMPYQPWTYAVPRIYKFDAVDLGSPRANPKAPDVLLVRVSRITRNTSTADIGMLVDCSKLRFSEVTAATQFGDDGVPTNPNWEPLSEYQSLQKVVCKSGSVPAQG